MGKDPAREAAQAWAGLSQQPTVLLVRNGQRARRLLLVALGLAPGARISLAANSSYEVVESIKRVGFRPEFADLTAQLTLSAQPDAAAVWQEVRLGLPNIPTPFATPWILDCLDSVPAGPLPKGVAAALFGLQLSPQVEQAGALLVFGEPTLGQAVQAIMRPEDHLTPPQDQAAFQQAHRLAALIPAQQQGLQRVAEGIRIAAGLPHMVSCSAFALAHGVAVQVPEECDPATFVIYAKGENTPVQWLPEITPIHPLAIPNQRATAQHLARWLLLPVNPHHDDELASQAVLGVVKAAEYLGVRWRTDPPRAAAYAQLLTEMYGADHDAYRPAFATCPAPPAAVAALQDVAQPAFCRM